MNVELTIRDRADLYAKAFPKWLASHPVVITQGDRDWLNANWVLGNDYKSSTGFYGSYPPNYLKRVGSMFPDAENVLHLFSGSLPAGNYLRVDTVQSADVQCDVQCDAEELSKHFEPGEFDLCYADPPYTKKDAEKYNSGMPNRRKVMAELAKVIRPGGFVVWLDTVYPMFRKIEWSVCGFIAIIRGTNHRYRVAAVFQRVSV